MGWMVEPVLIVDGESILKEGVVEPVLMGWMVRISLDRVGGRTSLDGVDGGTSLDRVDVCGTRLDGVVGEIRLDGWMS